MILHNDKIAYISLAIIIGLVLLKSYPLSNSVGPLGSSDYSSHIFKIWHISEKGISGWNSYWYGGHPLFKYYPPLAYLIPSNFTGFGLYFSYNLFFDIIWILIPVSFFIFLKQFTLNGIQRSVALFTISLSISTLVFFKNSNLPFITSLLFSSIFLIYFKKFMNNRCHLLKPIIFLIAVLMTHVLMALFLYISFIVWFFSKLPERKIIYKFLIIVIIPPILTSFWYLPFSQGIYSGREGGVSLLSDPISYTTFTVDQRLTTLGIPREIFILFMFLFACSVLFSFRKFKDKMFREFFPWLTLSVVLFFLLDYKRIVVMMIIPASFLIAFNCKKKILYFLTIPLIILNIIIFSSSSFVYNYIPDYPEVGNRAIFYGEEDACKGCSLYSVFLAPMNGNEIVTGWLPQSQNTNDLFLKREHYLKKLQTPTSINYTEFNSIARAGMLNYIIVGKNSKNITDYFDHNTVYKKFKEEGYFIIFETVEKFSYIEIDGEQIETVVKKGNGIETEFICKGGKLTIKETYDKDWLIKINGKPIKYRINKYGFIETDLEASGKCNMEMIYNTGLL